MYKVIIVEDEPIIRKGLTYKVDWPKINCIVIDSASNGIEGMDKIKSLRPDIVITDVRMPFKDGLEMLTETKDEYRYETIIISGFDEFKYAKQAIRLGVSDYLLKPIDINQLERTLKKLVHKIEKRKGQKSLEKQSQLYRKVLNLEFQPREKFTYSEAVINYIKENYCLDLTLKDVSNHLGISIASLNSRFKEDTNYSVNEFLIRYRILKALQLLQNEQMYVYEVAEKVGFNDYKYFSQVFRRYVGMSPTQFLSGEKVK